MSKTVLVLVGALVYIAAPFAGRASAVLLPVPDASFESVVVPVGDANGPGAWGLAGGAGGGAGFYAPEMPLPGTDGDRVARVYTRDAEGAFAAMFQDVAVIEEGFYYAEFKASTEPGFEPTHRPLEVFFERVPFVSGPQAHLGGDFFDPSLMNSSSMTDLSASAAVGPGSPAIGEFLRLVVVVGGMDGGVNIEDPRATYNVDDFKVFRLPLDEGAEPIEIPVGDSSFEVTSWQRSSANLGSSGVMRPDAMLFPNQQGDQLAYVGVRDRHDSFSALYQDVASVEPGTYTMTVGAGLDPGFEASNAGLLLLMEGIGADDSKVTLAERFVEPTELSNSMLTDLSLSFSVPEGSEHIGRDLRLVFVASGQDGASNLPDRRATYLLDNVQLDFEGLSAGFAADFDGDGDVDGDDLVLWQDGFGQTAAGDADGDGDSDGHDFVEWQRQYGSGVAAEGLASSPVPEPSTFAMSLVLAAWFSRRKCRA